MQDFLTSQHNTGKSTNTGRDFAFLIGGLAAGVLGSRLLPPLIAMASGATRASRSNDAFELLISDHRTILSLLTQMESISGGSMGDRGTLYLRLKRKLAKHALAEEDVVYPILHNQGNDASSSKDLYDDHADIKIFLFELEQKLLDGEDWQDTVRPLRQLIETHIQEEEENIFPRLRQMFDEKKTQAVSGQISREEALVL